MTSFRLCDLISSLFQSSPIPLSIECKDALGMESGQIVDCQITVSNNNDRSYMPTESRLNSTSGWSTSSIGGLLFYRNEYIQVCVSLQHVLSLLVEGAAVDLSVSVTFFPD